MYEHKRSPLKSKKAFLNRMICHLLVALLLVVFALSVGVVGHIYFDAMDLGTALLASITITSGLGLSVLPESTPGQLFASLYAIFSGYVYITTSSIIIAPILHRILHVFHLDD